MKKKRTAVILFFGLALSSFFDPSPLRAQTKRLSATVSIAPQVYFLKKIGGKRVDVHLLLPPGKDPHSYAPTPNRVAKLAKSDLLFLIGVPFERALLPKIRTIAPDVRVVETQEGVPKRKLESARGEGEHEREHEEAEEDPHIWLGPPLVKIQAKNIVRALAESDPDGTPFYSARYDRFMAELDRLHRRTAAVLAPFQGRTIYVFHPSFGYFTDTYRLRQQAVEIEGKQPKIKELAAFIKRAKKENVHTLFVQPQFDLNTMRKIATAIDGTVVTLDPMAKDYTANMEAMVQQVRDALE